MREEYLNEDEKFSLENCKILYKDVNKPCTETCACWGWDFGDGWNSSVKELSVKLEMLNLVFYPKYGVHVVMEQAKEKMGILHFYHSVRIESPLIYRMWRIPFEKAHYWLRRNIDYKYVSVTDREGYYSDEREEIPSEEVEEMKKRYENCSNVKVEELDGKWYTVTHLWHIPVTHREPTKHKFLNKAMNLMFKMSNLLYFVKEPSAKQLVIRDAVDSIASQYIREAEEKCYCVCEDCGTQIGTDWSPRVTTKGWISYICESCDVKRLIRHRIGGLEYMLKNSSVKLSDEEFGKINSAKNAVDGDDYVSAEELCKINEVLIPICERVDKEYAEEKKSENNKEQSK